MFACPKCGYRDDPCWKAACFLKVATYCRLDELRPWQPELAERIAKLKTGEVLIDGDYGYRLTRSGTVYRLLKEFHKIYSSHGFSETAPGSRMKKPIMAKHFSSYKNKDKSDQQSLFPHA